MKKKWGPKVGIIHNNQINTQIMKFNHNVIRVKKEKMMICFHSFHKLEVQNVIPSYQNIITKCKKNNKIKLKK